MKNPIYSISSECSGCKVCAEICPKKCISFYEDAEHFAYPRVDESLCIDCRRCVAVCPQKKATFNFVKEAFVGSHSHNEVFKSSSGGAFWALCQILIPLGYVVIGVKWMDGFKVAYDVAFTLDEAQGFRKSKYVLSDTNGIFQKVKNLLKDGKKVLFTGTPCQVAACKNYIGDSDKLFLVDIVCHGAPNQEIFNKEVNYIERKHNGKLESFEFRQKSPINGKVNSRSAKYVVNSKEYYVEINDDPFLRGYYSRLFYRPSCGTCHFARPERVGDVTLADAWGVHDILPDLDELVGVSLLLFNSSKSLLLLPEIRRFMSIRNVDKEWAISTNLQLRVPTRFHEYRCDFFKKIDVIDFEQNVRACTRVSIKMRIRKYLGLTIKKIIGYYKK